MRVAEIDITKLNLGDNPDSLVITELQTDAGTPGRIVYRCGGTVQLKQLERLCDRVGWPPRPIDKVKGALSNSYLVRILHISAARYAHAWRALTARILAAAAALRCAAVS